MQRAHADGLRRAKAFLKNRLTQPDQAEDVLVATLKLYLREWAKTYGEGSRVPALTPTERVVMTIRHDTLMQMAVELEKLFPEGQTVDGEVVPT